MNEANEMRKLMEAVGEFVGEERTSDSSTVKVLGKTEFTFDTEYNRVLNLEVREYKGNKFADDGVYVYITEDGYEGFSLDFKLEEFKKLISVIDDLMIEDISGQGR